MQYEASVLVANFGAGAAGVATQLQSFEARSSRMEQNEKGRKNTRDCIHLSMRTHGLVSGAFALAIDADAIASSYDRD